MYGSSVVSVWKGLPSTLPLRIAECRSLIGNSGLVTLVESENGGAERSTRSLSGATGSLSNSAAFSCAAVGCGISVDSAEPPSPPHPASRSAVAIPVPNRILIFGFIAASQP